MDDQSFNGYNTPTYSWKRMLDLGSWIFLIFLIPFVLLAVISQGSQPGDPLYVIKYTLADFGDVLVRIIGK